MVIPDPFQHDHPYLGVGKSSRPAPAIWTPTDGALFATDARVLTLVVIAVAQIAVAHCTVSHVATSCLAVPLERLLDRQHSDGRPGV
jgi:hypothetical protein